MPADLLFEIGCPGIGEVDVIVIVDVIDPRDRDRGRARARERHPDRDRSPESGLMSPPAGAGIVIGAAMVRAQIGPESGPISRGLRASTREIFAVAMEVPHAG
ncbi:MAG TPA: hypothetical protein VLM79_34610 [Kofleriaceae bacterium]|nr:hypothetical protein [Kofleriaceae bacterium]